MKRKIFPKLALFALLVFCSISPAFGMMEWNLTAGQYTDVGSVAVTNDLDNIYVTYALDYPGATLGNLHLWVGNNQLLIPSNPQGIPVPGQFCGADGGYCYDAAGQTSYTFTIPFTDLNLIDAGEVCGLPAYIFAHADVNMSGGVESAFGGDNPVNIDGPGRWYYFGIYTVCCDDGNPDPCLTEVAFAKGGYVWTTDRKSNPENLPSLNLTKNRWGWAIFVPEPGNTTYEIWAEAGLNKTSNGTKVGLLAIDWNSETSVYVTYQLFPGYHLEEIHIYADSAVPATTAPGRYGNPASGYDAGGVERIEVNVPYAYAPGQGLWIVAHAVVSNAACYAP